MIVVVSLSITIRLALPKMVEADTLQLEADLLGNDLASGQYRDVLQHGLAAVPEARGLDRAAPQRTSQLVDDERRHRVAFDILGDHQQRPA